MRLATFIVSAALLIILVATGHGRFSARAQDVNDEVRFLLTHTNENNLLQKFIKDYPNSANTETAQTRLNELTGNSAFPAPHMTKTFRVSPETMH